MATQKEAPPEVLFIEDILSTCISQDARRYEVRWSSAWVLAKQLPVGILEAYEKNEAPSGSFYIEAKKSMDDGTPQYLLCRRNTWESEEKLKDENQSLLDKYWSENVTVKEEEDLGEYGIGPIIDSVTESEDESELHGSSHEEIGKETDVMVKEEEDLSECNPINENISLIKSEENDEDTVGIESSIDRCSKCNIHIRFENEDNSTDSSLEKDSGEWKCQTCHKIFCQLCAVTTDDLTLQCKYREESSWCCDDCIAACCGELFGQETAAESQTWKNKINFPFFHRPLTHLTMSSKGVGVPKDEKERAKIIKPAECSSQIIGIKVLSGNHKDFVKSKEKSKKDGRHMRSEICDPSELFSSTRGRPIGEDKPNRNPNDVFVKEEENTPSFPSRRGEEEAFKCRYCNLTFSRQFTLDTHERIHTGAKPYECHICGAHFRQSGTRTTHIRAVHLKERPFQCEVCGKTFSHKSSITVHLRIHTNEKPYACEICEKRFTDRATYLKHQAVHTGIKPYGCPECGKAFTQKSNLRRHYQSKHMSAEKEESLVEIETNALEKQELSNLSSVIYEKHVSENLSNKSNDDGDADETAEEKHIIVKEDENSYVQVENETEEDSSNSDAREEDEEEEEDASEEEESYYEVTGDIPKDEALYFSFETPSGAECPESTDGEDKGHGKKGTDFIKFPWKKSIKVK